MAISPGSDTDDDAKSFHTTRSRSFSQQPPSITTYPPIAAVLPNQRQAFASTSTLAPHGKGKRLDSQGAQATPPQNSHVKIQTSQSTLAPPPTGLSHSTSAKSIRTPLRSPVSSAFSHHGDDDDSDDEDDSLRQQSQQEEHFFLIGDDMSAIPFFEAPRVIVANGPAPAPEDFIWHDEASYQAVLNKTTTRCVNILGETALKEPEEGSGKFKLKLIEMCDDRVPPNMRAAVGKGYYCCLMQQQEWLPRACMAVYHINPHYSTDFLYRVKAFSYDSTEPLVAEQPESILLALIGRQMALSNSLVGVITNGSFLIVVEAGTLNSVHGAHLRTHPQAFVDCAHDWNDNQQQGTLRSTDGQVYRSHHHQLHSLPPHAQPYTGDSPPVINPLERHPRNSGTYPWEQEYEARQQGFERADMMFAWYAVMLYAYEKHLQLALSALHIFQAYYAHRAAHDLDFDLAAIPAMPHTRGVGLGLSRNVAVVNCEDGVAARERYEELESDDPPPIRDEDVAGMDDAFRRMAEVREGLEIRRGSMIGRNGSGAPRSSPRINAPAPAWLRPTSTASSRHHSQAYDYNYNGYNYMAVDSGMPSPTISTPLEPASPTELGAGGPGSANHGSWFGGLANTGGGDNHRASGFSIPGTAWLRAAMPSSSSPAGEPSPSRRQPQRLFSSDSDASVAHGHDGGTRATLGGDLQQQQQQATPLGTPSSPGWIQWSPATSPRHSGDGIQASSTIHQPKPVRGQPVSIQRKRPVKSSKRNVASGAVAAAAAAAAEAATEGEEMELAEVSTTSSTYDGPGAGREKRDRLRNASPAGAALRQMMAEDERETLLPPPKDLLAQRFGGTKSPSGGSLASARGRRPSGVADVMDHHRLAPSQSNASMRSASSGTSTRTMERVMAGGAAAI